MIGHVTKWFEVTSDKKAIPIANLVENKWLVWYPCLVEIMYERGG